MSAATAKNMQHELALIRKEMQAGELYESLGLRIGELLDEWLTWQAPTPVAQLSQNEEENVLEVGLDLQQALLADELVAVSNEDLATIVNGLGQTDPNVREEASLKVLVQLIQNQLLTSEQLMILHEHVLRPEVLFFHILEPETDGAFLRSFNVCLLSVMKLWEQPLPLTPSDYDQMIEILSTYIALEGETRGFIDQKGGVRTFLHIGHVLDALSFDNQMPRLDKIFLLTVFLERYKRLETPLEMGEEKRLVMYMINLANMNSLYESYILLQLKQMRQEFIRQTDPVQLAGWHRLNNQRRLIEAFLLNPKTPQKIIDYLKDLNFF